jgi:hypothetical protein
MRTNIVLDDKLVREAMALSTSVSKKDLLDALADGSFCVTPIVLQELMQGARDEKEKGFDSEFVSANAAFLLSDESSDYLRKRGKNFLGGTKARHNHSTHH